MEAEEAGREAGEGMPRLATGGHPPGKFQDVRKMQPGRRWDAKMQLGWQLVGNLNFLSFLV